MKHNSLLYNVCGIVTGSNAEEVMCYACEPSNPGCGDRFVRDDMAKEFRRCTSGWCGKTKDEGGSTLSF